MDTNNENKDSSWERSLLEKAAMGLLKEQRRSRRWSIFFKFAFLVYLFLLLIPFIGTTDLDDKSLKVKPHTALVDINGKIGIDKQATADYIITGLRNAFEDKNTKGIILRINSPGGSSVQSGYVYDEINRLRNKYPDTKIYAVIMDIGASGGYYIASATDAIYANKASLVGSIGALISGFGFVDTMEKLGVERRLITSGEFKGFLDPFSPDNKEQRKYAESMVASVHQQFIDSVKAGRKGKLKEDYPNLFSGLVWTGEQGLELGLIDGIGSAGYVAREIIGEEKIFDYSLGEPWFNKLRGFFSEAFSEGLTSSLGATSNIIQ